MRVGINISIVGAGASHKDKIVVAAIDELTHSVVANKAAIGRNW